LTGKILAISVYSLVVTVLLGMSATVAGCLFVGTQPLVSLDGTLLSSSTALVVVLESWVSILAPVLAMTALALMVSVLTRYSWAGVLVPLVAVFIFNSALQLSLADPVRPYIPTTGFYAWYGLARTSLYTNQIWTSLLVSAGWTAACLGVAAFAFLRRDVVDA
jgi:ABC-type transport system involved in multi-copper enzyme maturation permease subunit